MGHMGVMVELVDAKGHVAVLRGDAADAVRNAQPIASIALPEHQLDEAVARVRALLDEE
jgi:hypothetical protein